MIDPIPVNIESPLALKFFVFWTFAYTNFDRSVDGRWPDLAVMIWSRTTFWMGDLGKTLPPKLDLVWTAEYFTDSTGSDVTYSCLSSVGLLWSLFKYLTSAGWQHREREVALSNWVSEWAGPVRCLHWDQSLLSPSRPCSWGLYWLKIYLFDTLSIITVYSSTTQ